MFPACHPLSVAACVSSFRSFLASTPSCGMHALHAHQFCSNRVGITCRCTSIDEPVIFPTCSQFHIRSPPFSSPAQAPSHSFRSLLCGYTSFPFLCPDVAVNSVTNRSCCISAFAASKLLLLPLRRLGDLHLTDLIQIRRYPRRRL